LKEQVQGLRNEVRDAKRRAEALGNLSDKRGAAISKFVYGWDKQAKVAETKSKKPRKKKK